MEVSLSQVCGPDDIITPISFEKEKRLGNIYWQLADWQILISAYNEAAMAN